MMMDRFCFVLIILYATEVHLQECGVLGTEQDLRVQGIPGKRGKPGAVNYKRVRQMIRSEENQDMQEVMEELKKTNEKIDNKVGVAELAKTKQEMEEVCSRKIEKLSEDLNSEIEEIRRMLDELKSGSPTVTSLCRVNHAGMCYWTVRKSMDYKGSVKECDIHHGTLADVGTHLLFGKLSKHIRDVMPSNAEYERYWTGMTYHSGRREVLTSNGQSSSFSQWHPERPANLASHNRIMIVVRQDEASGYQGMYDVNPASERLGVICQRPA